MHKFLALFIAITLATCPTYAQGLPVDDEGSGNEHVEESLLPSSIIPLSPEVMSRQLDVGLLETSEPSKRVSGEATQCASITVLKSPTTNEIQLDGIKSNCEANLVTNSDGTNVTKAKSLKAAEHIDRREPSARDRKTQKPSGSKMAKALGILGKGLVSTAQVALPAAAMVGGAYLMSQAINQSYTDSATFYAPIGFGFTNTVNPAMIGYPGGMYGGLYPAPRFSHSDISPVFPGGVFVGF